MCRSGRVRISEVFRFFLWEMGQTDIRGILSDRGGADQERRWPPPFPLQPRFGSQLLFRRFFLMRMQIPKLLHGEVGKCGRPGDQQQAVEPFDPGDEPKGAVG